MKTIPVNTNDLAFQAVSCEAKVFDGKQSTRTLEDGTTVPIWAVTAVVTGHAPKAEIVQVSIASKSEPAITPGSPIQFERLTCRPWDAAGVRNGELDKRNGLSFSADGVRPANPKTNGTKAAADLASAAA